MATRGEQTAIRVALIGPGSAVLVALIANADKLRETRLMLRCGRASPEAGSVCQPGRRG